MGPCSFTAVLQLRKYLVQTEMHFKKVQRKKVIGAKHFIYTSDFGYVRTTTRNENNITID